jgi:hypothetical protein
MAESLEHPAYDAGMERERDRQDEPEPEPEPEPENRRDWDPLDEAIEESFPASDPIAPEAPER